MSNPNDQAERRRVIRSAFVMMLLIFVGGAATAYWIWRIRRSDSGSTARVEMPPKFEETPGQFVGSAKCAKCHAEIAAKYADSAKAHSLRSIADAKVLENYDGKSFSPDGIKSFRVERDGEGNVTHHEFFNHPETGKTMYDQSESIEYVLGSGKRSRGYVLERNGVLLQSPIMWHAASNSFQKVSVQENVLEDPRFETQLSASCLRCHAGKVNVKSAQSDLYQSPPFLESAVGCENCHGPGGAHVAKQEKQRTTGPDDTIVNPDRLTFKRQEHLCASCHVQAPYTIPRYGANFLDFRAGMLLDDVFSVLLPEPENEAELSIASQIAQLKSSTCYTKSPGELTCAKCHDAHREPAPQEVAGFYANKCNQCHAEQPCTESEDVRKAAPASGSCIHCHMPKLGNEPRPHSTFTDHRIRRTPSKNEGQITFKFERMRVFDDGSSRLSSRENERSMALAEMQNAAQQEDPQKAVQAGAKLLPREVPLNDGLDQLRDDIPVLAALGRVFVFMAKGDTALQCWNQALESDPQNREALSFLGQSAFATKRPDDVVKYSDQLLKLNPYLPGIHAQRALGLKMLNRDEEAIEAAKRALKLNPTFLEMRYWLAEAYREQGRQQAADEAEAFAKTLENAGFREPPPPSPNSQKVSPLGGK